jgi:mannitol/fructose-specific phosphotransferase system IIA component (Ntr-type)
VSTLAELLKPEGMTMELREKRKKKVLTELSGLLAAAWDLDNPAALSGEILQREKMGSTGIGHGVAIPHCLTSMADFTAMAFGRSSQGVSYGAPDNRPVHLLFLLVGPQSATAEHLKLLSKLSRLLTEEDFRNRLLTAGEPEEVIALFRRREEL